MPPTRTTELTMTLVHHRRDWQSVAYLIALPTLVSWQWQQAAVNAAAYGLTLMLVIGLCCINHNHAHLPIWRYPILNRITDLWIGLLQGQPVFLFQPAHVDSHHRHNQSPGDLTRVARHDTGNTLLGYLRFPFQVLPALQRLRRDHLRKCWHQDRAEFWWIMLQHLALLSLWATLVVLDPFKALIYVALPQLLGLHFLLASNYLQHAHAVAGSRHNHSRNFVGWINWFWFNVGYHTAHHDNERLHWTELPSAHAALLPDIRPALIERSVLLYFVRTLFLGQFIAALRSRQLID